MNASWRRICKNALCAALAALLALSAAPVRASELPTAQDDRDLTVRVLLSRLGVTDRIDLTLASPYVMRLGSGGELRFAGGAELHVLLKNDRLYAYYEGMSLNAGQSLTLTRSPVEDGTEYGLRRANFPALYAGDLTLSVADGIIRPVLSLDVEDYLKGVVPYEMNNSFPLEALKAQAIAARTYALRKQSSQDAYDVVDTTNDQAYRGYTAGNDLVERAISETRGVCGFYNGSLAQCYYSASNGGQTELTSTVWPNGESLAYYAFGADKYDVENPASTVKSIEIAKRYGADEIAPYGLRRFLAEQLAGKLTSLGYDPSPESVRVDQALKVSVDTPKGEAGSKLMTAIHMELKLSGRTSSRARVVLEDQNDEEVSLFGSATATPALAGAAATPEPTASPTPAPSYGPFTPLSETVVIDAQIFPDAEKAFAMNISSNYQNELWSVKETGSAFTVEARRYGHGVGMSQRGAQWMAGKYAMTCEQILAFYYPGMTLMRYPESVQMSVREDAALAEKAGPAPTPTPRPTLMPATMQAADGQWFAEVTGIDDDSTLNLRSDPDMGGDIIMRLFKYQRLLVVERCPEDGWVKVRTDAVEGYVVESYLTKLN